MYLGAKRRYINTLPFLSFPSNRYHLSYDDCVEDKRENYQNCSVLCCAQQYAHTRDTQAVLKNECWFKFSFVHLFRLNILCFSGLA